jgi:hypothetical protein
MESVPVDVAIVDDIVVVDTAVVDCVRDGCIDDDVDVDMAPDGGSSVVGHGSGI